jgi:hypothetical protein
MRQPNSALPTERSAAMDAFLKIDSASLISESTSRIPMPQPINCRGLILLKAWFISPQNELSSPSRYPLQ